VALIGCACVISLITFGVRTIFGLFTDPVVQSHGWSREIFAMAIAVQNLFWGLGQPFAGMLVDRFGPIRVLVVGGVVYAAGTASMALTATPLGLHLGAGVLVGLGMSGASFIYIGRTAAIAAFILLPATASTVVVFALIMGVLWLSTVPLTSGLVAVMFGTRYMGMLFGFVFFSHQLGSFLGVWLGGLCTRLPAATRWFGG